MGKEEVGGDPYAPLLGVFAPPVPRATAMGWRHRQRDKQVITAAFPGRGGFAAAKELGWYIGHRKWSRFS